MKLQSYRRLQRGDYEPQFQDLVDKLAFTINSSFESLFFVLNGQASLTDNILASVNTFNVIVDSNGNPINSTQFTTTLSGQVNGITVVSAVNATKSTAYPTGTPFISFFKTNKTIAVNNITSLTPGDSWVITAITWGK